VLTDKSWFFGMISALIAALVTLKKRNRFLLYMGFCWSRRIISLLVSHTILRSYLIGLGGLSRVDLARWHSGVVDICCCANSYV
jgi:hypothetical protein